MQTLPAFGIAPADATLTAMAERMLEHRRGTDRYHDAVAYTSWKIARHIKKDLGYKVSLPAGRGTCRRGTHLSAASTLSLPVSD